MDAPVRRRWLADPLALDVGLQLLVFWTGAFGHGASLPCRIGRYRQFRRFPKDGTRVVLRVTSHDTGRALGDVEIVDGDGRLVARLEDCENTIDPGLARRFSEEGRMPNFKKLEEEGCFSPLQTAIPSISPVAWSTELSARGTSSSRQIGPGMTKRNCAPVD